MTELHFDLEIIIMNKNIDVSTVLPTYNEAKRLEETVEITASTLSRITSSFEIIIAE